MLDDVFLLVEIKMIIVVGVGFIFFKIEAHQFMEGVLFLFLVEILCQAVGGRDGVVKLCVVVG